MPRLQSVVGSNPTQGSSFLFLELCWVWLCVFSFCLTVSLVFRCEFSIFCYTNWWLFVCRICGGTRAACEKTTWTQTSGIHLQFPSPAPQLRFNNCLLLYIDNVTAESFNSCASCRGHRQNQGIQKFFLSRTALKFMFQNTVYNRRAYHSSSVSATIETLLTTTHAETKKLHSRATAISPSNFIKLAQQKHNNCEKRGIY